MGLSSYAALGLIWLPLVLLRQVDAFLAFKRPLELAGDLALAYVLLLVPVALLTTLALMLKFVLRRLGLRREPANGAAWFVVMGPTLWVCSWQLGGSAWAWLKTVTASSTLTIGSHGRVAASVALLLVLLLLIRRQGMAAFFGGLVHRLRALHRPALLMLALSVGLLLVQPPRLLSRPAPAAVVAGGADKPDIILITIDTLAEADAQVCGDGPTLMPRLREFAQQATCFSRHYASSNFTTPSTATMETGSLPWNHWAVQIVAKVASPLQPVSLAAQLRAAGYETHAVSTNLLASPRHHGTDRSYDSEVIAPSTSWGAKPREVLTLFPDTTLPYWFSAIVPFLDTLDIYRHGEQHPYAPEQAYAVLQQRMAERHQRPQFFWVHTLPPHDPYLPPASTKHKLLNGPELARWSEFQAMGPYAADKQPLMDKYRLRYREAIMGSDEALGRLLDQLRASGRLDKAIIVISSDHGESFERGFLGHAGGLIHNAVLQVPLVVRLPGQQAAQRISTPVSLADIAPTIADLAHAPTLPQADGRSLRAALETGAIEPRPVYAMAMERQSRFETIRAGHYAVIDGDYKLVLHLAEKHSELFDLSRDPLELQDLSKTEPQRAATMRQMLEAQLHQAEAHRQSLFDRH
ncbi:sulfatase [Paucibacter sp. JuS9]|uniref:sulfatase family protein n=1 Tax=Roseateles TaxID=93681 RepID=UPI002FE5424E